MNYSKFVSITALIWAITKVANQYVSIPIDEMTYNIVTDAVASVLISFGFLKDKVKTKVNNYIQNEIKKGSELTNG